MKYSTITFKTLTGNQEYIDLGDQYYDEWIIYEDKFPKFHINCFKENSHADSLIKSLIENEKWTIEELL